jgi:hypothetical protein
LKRSVFALLAAVALLSALIPATAVAAGGSSVHVRTITRGATLAVHGNAPASSIGAFESPEFPTAEGEDGADGGDGPHGQTPPGHGQPGPGGPSNGLAHANPELDRSFLGLNHRDQRTANGGNQFSLEPPDQGLCAGNGFVVETINDVLRVYDTSGAAQTGVVDLNTFYGYIAQINRTTGAFGPFITDPSCLYDVATQRWFMVVLTLDQDIHTGAFLGTNHLDVAVSKTSNPTGDWVVYRLPVQDDGSDGTPNHHCSEGPCIGDYPHIGADTNGFYVTTNEYSFFGPEYKAAQIYAFSKQALAANASVVTVVQFDTSGADNGNPGFTIWPATSASGVGSAAHGGSEFFLSTNAAEEPNGTGQSNHIVMWTLQHTNRLGTAHPNLVLVDKSLKVKKYATPPAANQKVGSTPLRDCLNDVPCATFLNLEPDPFHEKEYALDANDTRMQQVVYANGQLYGAWDTALKVGGKNTAGIEWVSVDAAHGQVNDNDYVGLSNTNLTYPALAVLANGRGVMAFTVVGKDFFPSAGYAVLGPNGVGTIHVAAAGAGPADGFSGYAYYNAPDPARPRWGDYGAAVPLGNSVWIASEYIAQTCTLAQYEATPFGSCGGTRTALANWATRISKVTP